MRTATSANSVANAKTVEVGRCRAGFAKSIRNKWAGNVGKYHHCFLFVFCNPLLCLFVFSSWLQNRKESPTDHSGSISLFFPPFFFSLFFNHIPVPPGTKIALMPMKDSWAGIIAEGLHCSVASIPLSFISAEVWGQLSSLSQDFTMVK